MKASAGWIGCMAVACCLSSGVAVAASAMPPPLAPYQMVRSLRLAQDRIAGGDQAALPMQKKMIDLIDQRLNEATAEEFADRRNLDALLIYGMSGGNPKTFERVADRVHLDENDRDIASGILAYFNSDPGKAAKLLASVSPDDETPAVGAFLALIKGTVRSIDHPVEGLALLDQARLLAPGSLVEEAALRRSISLAADTHDPARFLKASEQYVRRFLKSPYASHFADGFINGIIAMHDQLDLARLKSIIDMMNADQQTAVYLRIARKSAIQGRTDLAAFASTGAEAVSAGADKTPDPRAELYNALATVTSGSVEAVSQKLAGIDPKDLSKRDVRLLKAAKEVVRNVLAEPVAPGGQANEGRPDEKVARSEPRPAPETGPAADVTQDRRTPTQPAPAQAGEEQPGAQPPVRIVRTERVPLDEEDRPAATRAPPVGQAGVEQPSLERLTGEAGAPQAEPEMELVTETRKKLDEIDKLLGETQ